MAAETALLLLGLLDIIPTACCAMGRLKFSCTEIIGGKSRVSSFSVAVGHLGEFLGRIKHV
jgi:hypothetical protein